MDDFTQQGIAALKAGDQPQARQLLTQAIRQNKQDILAWYALSFAVDKEKEQAFCLQQVLKLDPNHAKAQQRLAKIIQPAEPIVPEPEHQPGAEDEIREVGEETAVSLPPSSPTAKTRLKQIFFDEPHLPKPLIFLAVLSILSDSFITLIGQSDSYWLDFSNGMTYFFPWFDPILRIHPLFYLATFWIMALGVALALRYLSYKPAIILWMVMSFRHLDSFVGWAHCALPELIFPSNPNCNLSINAGLMIVVALLLGSLLALTLLPLNLSRRKWENASPKIPTITKPIWIGSGIWLTLLLIWLIWIISVPSRGWVPLDVEYRPSPRASSGLAYDTDRQRAVLFGGGSEHSGGEWYNWNTLGDTWEWDGNTWHQLDPQVSPSPRMSSAMAYDPYRKVTILFGGITAEGVVGDTWEWDGKQWQQIFPDNSPPAVCCGKMFFDPQLGHVILHSGFGGDDYFPRESWEWDGNNWKTCACDPDAPHGAGYSLAYDSNQLQAVAVFPVFGTYTWSYQIWHQITERTAISERTDAAMAFAPSQGLTVLFGGVQNTFPINDTWTFNGSEWEELKLEESPDPMSRHMMFYDDTRGNIILFGGQTEEGTHNEMWELHLP